MKHYYLSLIQYLPIPNRDSGEEKKVTLPIICKTLPKNIVHRKTFRITDFFRNETTFYNKVSIRKVTYKTTHTNFVIKNNHQNR